jgi:hypothetical protein
MAVSCGSFLVLGAGLSSLPFVFSSGQFLVEMLEVAFHTHSTMTWSLWCAEDPTGLPVEQSAGGGGWLAAWEEGFYRWDRKKGIQGMFPEGLGTAQGGQGALPWRSCGLGLGSFEERLECGDPVIQHCKPGHV